MRKHETQSCSESCVFSFSNPILYTALHKCVLSVYYNFSRLLFLSLQIFSSEDAISYFIDGSEDSNNWMKFVNSAISEAEQNMSVVQQEREIYYEATKNISKGTELMVWYGRNYEMFMGIPMALRKEGMESKATPQRKSYPWIAPLAF